MNSVKGIAAHQAAIALTNEKKRSPYSSAGYTITRDTLAQGVGFDKIEADLVAQGMLIKPWAHQLAAIEFMRQIEGGTKHGFLPTNNGANQEEGAQMMRVTERARCGQLVMPPGSGKTVAAIGYVVTTDVVPPPINNVMTDALKSIYTNAIDLPATFFVVPPHLVLHWCHQIRKCYFDDAEEPMSNEKPIAKPAKWLLISNQESPLIETISHSEFEGRIEYYTQTYPNIVISESGLKALLTPTFLSTFNIYRVVIDEALINLPMPNARFVWILCATFRALQTRIEAGATRNKSLYGGLRQAYKKWGSSLTYAIDVAPGVIERLPEIKGHQIFVPITIDMPGEKGELYRPDFESHCKLANIQFLNGNTLLKHLNTMTTKFYMENPKAAIVIFFYGPVCEYDVLTRYYKHWQNITNSFYIKNAANRQLEVFTQAARTNKPCLAIINGQFGYVGFNIPEATHLMLIGEIPEDFEKQMIGRAQRVPRKTSLNLYRILPEYTADGLNKLFFGALNANTKQGNTASVLVNELNRHDVADRANGTTLTWNEQLAKRRHECFDIAVTARKMVASTQAKRSRAQTMLKNAGPVMFDKVSFGQIDESDEDVPLDHFITAKPVISEKRLPPLKRKNEGEEEESADESEGEDSEEPMTDQSIMRLPTAVHHVAQKRVKT